MLDPLMLAGLILSSNGVFFVRYEMYHFEKEAVASRFETGTSCKKASMFIVRLNKSLVGPKAWIEVGKKI